MKIQIIVSENGKTYAGEATLTPTGGPTKLRPEQRQRTGPTRANKPSQALDLLYRTKFFGHARTLGNTVEKLGKDGYNFNSPSVLMALKSKEFLQRRGSKGNYRFIQKYPPSG